MNRRESLIILASGVLSTGLSTALVEIYERNRDKNERIIEEIDKYINESEGEGVDIDYVYNRMLNSSQFGEQISIIGRENFNILFANTQKLNGLIERKQERLRFIHNNAFSVRGYQSNVKSLELRF